MSNQVDAKNIENDPWFAYVPIQQKCRLNQRQIGNGYTKAKHETKLVNTRLELKLQKDKNRARQIAG